MSKSLKIKLIKNCKSNWKCSHCSSDIPIGNNYLRAEVRDTRYDTMCSNPVVLCMSCYRLHVSSYHYSQIDSAYPKALRYSRGTVNSDFSEAFKKLLPEEFVSKPQQALPYRLQGRTASRSYTCSCGCGKRIPQGYAYLNIRNLSAETTRGYHCICAQHALSTPSISDINMDISIEKHGEFLKRLKERNNQNESRKILASVCPRNGKEMSIIRGIFQEFGIRKDAIKSLTDHQGGATFALYVENDDLGMLRYNQRDTPVELVNPVEFNRYLRFWKDKRKSGTTPAYSEFLVIREHTTQINTEETDAFGRLRVDDSLSVNEAFEMVVKSRKGRMLHNVIQPQNIPKSIVNGVLLPGQEHLAKSERRRNFIKNLKSAK